MQASTVHPVSNFTTTQNTTSTTKSTQQVLIQSSGAMIAIIVIGIIIILTILLIILKTYNRRTHAARMLAGSSNKKRKNTTTAAHTNMVMANTRANSGLGSFAQSTASSENGFHLPRVDLGNGDQHPMEHFSTTSGSTIVTIHDTPSVENT